MQNFQNTILEYFILYVIPFFDNQYRNIYINNVFIDIHSIVYIVKYNIFNLTLTLLNYLTLFI